MSTVSEIHLRNSPASVSETPEVERPAARKPPKEIYGYKSALTKDEAIKKCLGTMSDQARDQVWMSPDLLIYSNSEYVFATFPIALALFLGQGGWGGSVFQNHRP